MLAWAAGLGGGILRDVLIGAVPPVGISNWRFIATAVAGATLIYFFHPRLERARRFIVVLDAGALALFSVVGTIKGLEYGTTLTAAVVVGVMTGRRRGSAARPAVGGGACGPAPPAALRRCPRSSGRPRRRSCGGRAPSPPSTSVVVVVAVFVLRVSALRFQLKAPGAVAGDGALTRVHCEDGPGEPRLS